MKIIDKKLLDETTAKARQSPRLRMNYNFHEDMDEPVNRLINAMEPGTYLRPHRHLNPDKDESFLILRGKVVIFTFDDNGVVTERLTLDPQNGVYGADIKAGVWHGLIVLEHGTVLYEAKPGPFVPLPAGNFAPWSPEPEDTAAVESYMTRLLHGDGE
ncbi:MAG: WbuC family cupin fold metalloprotein [Tannerellaceae bacterium]|jgi:cupin fold WbuC family metalloprotein|nr:WbuC family cupin fold metalloprotein [Tannerellaceae bacterium]